MVQCTSVSEASWKTMALVPPARPGERGGEHEGDELVAVGLVAERERARLVLADRLQHLAERRVDRPVDEQEPAQEDREHDVVHDQRVAQVQEPEQHSARDGLDAVLAVGERGLQAEEEEHLGQRQRDHREVDALTPDGQRADREPEQRRGRGAEQDGQLGRPAPHLGRVRGDVAGRAQVRGVAEREQARVADQQVEGAREEGEAERLHQEDRVDHERAHHEGRHHHREHHGLVAQPARPAGHPGLRVALRGRHATGPARRGRPASRAGRGP